MLNKSQKLNLNILNPYIRLFLILFNFSLVLFCFKQNMIAKEQFASANLILLISFVINTIVFIYKKEFSALVNLLFDTTLMGGVLFLLGGVYNPFLILLLLPLLLSCLTLDKIKLVIYLIYFLIVMICLTYSEYPIYYQDFSFVDLFLIILFLSGFALCFLGIWLRQLLKNEFFEQKKLLQNNLRFDRYKGLGLLAAGVCHEMGTSINTLFLEVDRIDDSTVNKDKILGNLSKIDKSLKKMNQHFYDSDLSEMTETVDLKELFINLKNVYFNQITIELNIDDHLNALSLPHILFRTSICEIIENAISVSASKIKIDINQNEDFVDFNICDNGPGFDKIILENYGKPFYTTKKNGTGLAIYHFNNLLNLLGSSLQLSNRNGACIEFSINYNYR